MADIANFIAQNSPRFNRAAVDREHYGNALMRNEVDRLPQQNRAQDLAIQRMEQTNNSGAVENAMGILDRQLAMMEARPETAVQITSSPDWDQLTGFLKLPPSRVTPDEAPESIRAQAQQLRQALRGASGAGMPAGVVEFEHMAGAGGLTPEQRARAARVSLGLDSRAGQGRVTMVNNVPTWTGIGDDGQPFQIPLSSLGSEAAAAGQVKQAEALGSGRGQAQADREAGAPQRAERARQTITNIDNVLSAVDAAAAKIDWNTTGFVGNATKNIAGSPAHDLQQQLLTIQANLGFDRIQQMRESSPTGGALGQVAVQELNALQASVAALAQSQSDAQLRDNLQKVKTHYTNWRNVIAQAQQGSGMPDFSQMSDEELRRLAGGD